MQRLVFRFLPSWCGCRSVTSRGTARRAWRLSAYVCIGFSKNRLEKWPRVLRPCTHCCCERRNFPSSSLPPFYLPENKAPSRALICTTKKKLDKAKRARKSTNSRFTSFFFDRFEFYFKRKTRAKKSLFCISQVHLFFYSL